VGDSGAKKQQERAFPRTEVLLCVLVRNDPIDLKNLDHRSSGQGDQDSETPWPIDSFLTKLGVHQARVLGISENTVHLSTSRAFGTKICHAHDLRGKATTVEVFSPRKSEIPDAQHAETSDFERCGHHKFLSAHNLSSLALNFRRSLPVCP
jgi:hypothetical protein